ncbi:protein PTST, chloroplastic [Nymphaea colorata]|nr:protein PTST, chloroplastic [Nymphaea colorata]XP_031474717.1 protein PTST, chloroplastic [Nymphaea colorata]
MAGCARCSEITGTWGLWKSKKQVASRLHKSCNYSSTACVKPKLRRVSLLAYTITSQFNHWAKKFSVDSSFQTSEQWRIFSLPVNLENEAGSLANSSSDVDFISEDQPDEPVSKILDNDQLEMLLTDSVRENLTRKLSEANQHNRFLKRQLQVKEDALVKCTEELALMELELQALIGLAEEVAKSGVPPGSRKINGKYIHSHLVSRLENLSEKLKEQTKDVGDMKFRNVSLSWFGMAECVQVMGSFDGWSQGEDMSPEYTGGANKFSAELKLRPGRYEIKFLVDGEWQLSSELPTTGEGMMENNLLIVE